MSGIPGSLGLGGTGIGANGNSIQRPRKMMSENVPPPPVMQIQQQQQQLAAEQELQRQNSLRRGNAVSQNTNTNNLGLATGAVGVGSASALKASRAAASGVAGGSIRASLTETVPEESEENEPKSVGNEEESLAPNSSISITRQPEITEKEGYTFNDSGPETSSSSDFQGEGGRPLSPPNLNENSPSSSSDEGEGGSSSGEGEVSSNSSNEEGEEFDSEQVTAIYRPGAIDGKPVEQDEWAKLKEAGIKEREKREAERRKREGEAGEVSFGLESISTLTRAKGPWRLSDTFYRLFCLLLDLYYSSSTSSHF